MIPTIRLSNGAAMPVLGLGTYPIADGAPVRNALHRAFELGYRHIDTASVYKNETGIGEAIRETTIPREDIFLVTKVWNDHQYGDVVPDAFGRSLDRLGLPYVDLYLIHHPIDPLITRTWKNLESFQEDGRTRAIGVSNFHVHHLEMLLAEARIKPVVNQIKVHPLHQNRRAVEFCKKHDIAVVALSPFEGGSLLKHEPIVKIAQDLGRSPSQVILRWIWQHGIAAIPKSDDPTRMATNRAMFDFELPADIMAQLDAMDEG